MYVGFLVVVLWAIAFLGDVHVLTTIDRGSPEPPLTAAAIDLALLGAFAVSGPVLDSKASRTCSRPTARRRRPCETQPTSRRVGICGEAAAIPGIPAREQRKRPRRGQKGPDIASRLGGPNTCGLAIWNDDPGETGTNLDVPSCSVGVALATSPAEVILPDGTEVIAFHGANGELWTFRENPGTVGSFHDQGVQMADLTSPSIAVDGSEAAIAFQDSDGELWTWEGTGGAVGTAVDQHMAMIPDTSPSIGVFSGLNGDVVVAFDGINHDLWAFLGQATEFSTSGSGAADTGLGMAAGLTSPSLAIWGAYAEVAFQANTGILWTWEAWYGDGFSGAGTGSGLSTGLAMAPNTSPSIASTIGPYGGASEVAFQDANNHLSLWNPGGEAELTLGMAAGTSPSITAVDDGQPAIAFQASNSNGLWTVLANVVPTPNGYVAHPALCPSQFESGCPASGLLMGSFTSPSIVAAIPPPAGLSLTAQGDILARLRKPRTMVLLVYSTQHGHQRLLGRVALGNHPAGLSRIKWGLRVDGHRLGAGEYLAELEARLSGTALTAGGPTAGFQITHAGRLKIGRLSCSARASTC